MISLPFSQSLALVLYFVLQFESTGYHRLELSQHLCVYQIFVNSCRDIGKVIVQPQYCWLSSSSMLGFQVFVFHERETEILVFLQREPELF